MRRFLNAVAASLLAATAALSFGAAPAYADKIRNDQWHLSFLEVARVHALSQGEGMTVAVVDTGIDPNHVDLKGSVLSGLDVVPGGSGDGWGDLDGHGTGMAGLIAAHGHGPGNADGALGLAPKAKILPIRLKTSGDWGKGKELGNAVDEAVKRGAKIISISVNSDANSYDPIQKAIKAGVIVVASVGNQPGDFFIGDPAAHPGVVGVGAVGKDGNIAPVSVRGSAVALVAPGVEIVSSGRNGGYRIGTGTSPSTALVAAAAALVWSKYPQLTSTQVVEHLQKTATDKGTPGRDNDYGFGVLNVVKALETAPSTAGPTASATSTASKPSGNNQASPEKKSNTGLLIGIGVGVVLLIIIVVVALSRRRSS